MLAYSSLGQLGVVFIAFSLPGPAGILAGLAVALHHLVIKSALFGLATRWGGSLAALAGSARSAPVASVLFVLFALSLVGVPPLPGFWIKLLVLAGLAESGVQLGQPMAMTALLIILLATAVEANYLFRVAMRLYQPAEAGRSPPRPARLDVAIAAVFGLMLITATFAINPLAAMLGTIAEQTADVAGYIETQFPSAIARMP